MLGLSTRRKEEEKAKLKGKEKKEKKKGSDPVTYDKGENKRKKILPSTVLSRQIRYLRPGIITPVAVLAGPCICDRR